MKDHVRRIWIDTSYRLAKKIQAADNEQMALGAADGDIHSSLSRKNPSAPAHSARAIANQRQNDDICLAALKRIDGANKRIVAAHRQKAIEMRQAPAPQSCQRVLKFVDLSLYGRERMASVGFLGTGGGPQ